MNYKPENYNSVSPYFIVKGAQKLIDLLVDVFDGKEVRRFEKPDGSIMHAEVLIDDSIIMLGEASKQFPAMKQVIHVYVSDVDSTFKKAIGAGCDSIEVPKENPGDPDKRGTFADFAGNMWSIGTQLSA